MSSRIPRIVRPPFWIESSDIASRRQAGTFLFDVVHRTESGEVEYEDIVLGGYRQLADGTVSVAARMFDSEEQMPEIIDVEGRDGVLIDIPAAKSLLKHIARPCIGEIILHEANAGLYAAGKNRADQTQDRPIITTKDVA